MTKRFRVYTDHVGGLGIGEPLYRDLTESKAKRIVKTLSERGLQAIYTYSSIDTEIVK